MRISHKMLLIVITLITIFSIQPAIKAEPMAVAFTDHLGLVMFDGEINGKEGKLLLDTGADNSIINTRFVEELGIKEIKGPYGLLGLGGISQYKADTFAFADWSFENVKFFGMDLAIIERYFGFDILAVIGGDMLKHYVLTVDYQDEIFYLSKKSPEISGDAVSAPIWIRDNLVFVRGRTKADGTEYAFLVDTGATATLYFRNRIEECCPDYKSWSSSLGWAEATFLGKLEADLYEMPEFHVGDIGIEPMTIVVTEAGLLGLGLNIIAGEPLHGVIGYSFMKYFKVTFDYPNQKMIFEPYEFYKERFPYMFDSVGFMIAYKDGVPMIDHIIPDTPAESSGVQIGDILIEVNGTDVKGMDSLELSKLFMGKPGTDVKMLFERDGKRFFKTMKRVHLFK